MGGNLKEKEHFFFNDVMTFKRHKYQWINAIASSTVNYCVTSSISFLRKYF